MKRLPRIDIFFALGFLLVALAFLWETTLGGRILLPTDNLYIFPPFDALRNNSFVPHNLLISDMLLQNISWKALAREAILGGQMPLWNPYIFSGVPFLAAGQPGALYPLGALFYALKPEQAYGWFTALHLFLAGLFTYFYLRVIGVTRFGGIVGGLTFMFSGFIVVSFLWPMVVSTAIWIPLLLAAIEATISREERGRSFQLLWPIAGAVGVGLQFLAGHMEISFYILFTMLYYTACRLAVMLATTRNLLLTFRTGAILLGMVTVGAGLAAPQLLTFQEVIKENFRSGFVTYAEVIGWALPKTQVLSFLMPDFFGNPTHHAYFDVFDVQSKIVGNNMLGKLTDPPGTIFWGIKNYVEAASYIGVLPLALAAGAILLRRTRHTLIFASYAGFSLLLAFGSPLYAIFFYGIPGFDQLHTPFRWIYPYTISMAMLAGIGAGHIFSSTAFSEWSITAKRFGRTYSLLVFSVGFLVAVGVGVSLILRDRTLALAAQLLDRSPKLQQAFAGPEMFASYEMRNLLLFGILLASSGGLIWLAVSSIKGGPAPPLADRDVRHYIWLNLFAQGIGLRREGSSRLLKSLAIMLLVADVFYFGSGFNTKGDPGDLATTPPSIAFVKSDPDIFRIATYGTDDILKPNLGMRYGLQDIRGYDTIILKQYVEFWRLMEEPHGLLYSMIKTINKADSLKSQWLDLLNVKYILSSRPLSVDGLELAYSGEMQIYRNPNHLPRAFLVSSVRGAVTAEQALGEMRDPSFDPRREVVLEDWPPDNGGLNLGAGPHSQPLREGPVTSARIVAYEANRVSIEAQTADDAILVLSDTFFPGWQATVDDRDATIYRANRNFRAVPLPAGSHQIVFKYNPLPLKVGYLGTLVSVVVIVFGLAIVATSRFYRRGGEAAVQRVARNSFAPMATSLANKVMDIAFAMLVLRILGAENVGKYVFATVIYAYFDILTNFGLTTLAQREVAKDRSLSNTYLSNSLLLRVFLTFLAAPVIAAFLYGWRELFGLDGDTTLAVVLLAISLLPGNVAAAFSSLFLVHEKMEYPAGVTVASTVLKIVLGAAALLAGWGIVGLAGVALVVNILTAAVFAVLVVKILPRPRLEVDSKLGKWMLSASWPLMINQLLATMFFRTDTFILESSRGSKELGYYGTAYKFIDGLNIIPSTFTIALFPVLSRYADSSRDAFVRAYALALRFLLMLSMPIAVGTTFLAQPIILLFGGPEYLPHSVLALQVLIWFLPFSYVNSLTQYVLIAINQQRFITISFIVATSFNVTANLFLIPRYGYVGAGVVTIISEIVLLLPFLYAVYRYLGPVPLIALAVRPAIAAGVMALALWQLRGSEAPTLFLVGATSYCAALVLLGAFTTEDLQIARRLLGRQQA